MLAQPVAAGNDTRQARRVPLAVRSRSARFEMPVEGVSSESNPPQRGGRRRERRGRPEEAGGAGDERRATPTPGSQRWPGRITVGNDLSTQMPAFGVPGIAPRACWCLCAARWPEACNDDVAPRVHLSRTCAHALEIVPLEMLCKFVWDTG